MIDHDSNHKRPFAHDPSSSLNMKLRIISSASVNFKNFDVPLLSSTQNATVSRCDSMHLRADQPYSIGRRPRYCEFVFLDRRVSKRHCQVLFDASLRKLYILNGVLPHGHGDSTATCRLVHEFRKRAMISFHGNGDDGDGVALLREASNGVLVNGVEIQKGKAV